MKKTEKENKKTNYFYCSNFIFECNLSVQAKLVYVFLRRCANADGECFPGYRHISEKCQISRKTAIAAIKDLVEMNLIVKESRKNGKKTSSNLYRINLVWKPTEDDESKSLEPFETSLEHPASIANTLGEVYQEHPPSIAGTRGEVSQEHPPSIAGALGEVSQEHPPSIAGAPGEVSQEYPPSVTENLEGIHNISTTNNKDNANYMNTNYMAPPPNHNNEENSNVSLVVDTKNKDKILEELKERIEYDILAEDHSNIDLLDQIIQIMLDILISTKNEIRIGNEYINSGAAKQKILGITGYEIQYVIDVFFSCETEIKNIRAYLKTVLWNASMNADVFYYNRARSAEIR